MFVMQEVWRQRRRRARDKEEDRRRLRRLTLQTFYGYLVRIEGGTVSLTNAVGVSRAPAAAATLAPCVHKAALWNVLSISRATPPLAWCC